MDDIIGLVEKSSPMIELANGLIVAINPSEPHEFSDSFWVPQCTGKIKPQ
jgi:hypothetical protein